MKKLLSCTLFYLFLIGMFAFIRPFAGKAQQVSAKPAAGVNFIENSWGEALKQAALQKKYIFVDAYASWCGPCKLLKATTFKNKKAAGFYNDNFINVSIDMEKGQGPELAEQWGLQAYPTLIIFDSTGKPVLESVGYIKASDLIRFGVQALNK